MEAVEQGQELPTVLVVEDDPLLQDMVEDALDEGGFKVATVGSAEEAIALLKGKGTTYCALITDINLPGGMDGWEIARIARDSDCKRNGCGISHHRHDRCRWRRVALQGCSK